MALDIQIAMKYIFLKAAKPALERKHVVKILIYLMCDKFVALIFAADWFWCKYWIVTILGLLHTDDVSASKGRDEGYYGTMVLPNTSEICVPVSVYLYMQWGINFLLLFKWSKLFCLFCIVVFLHIIPLNSRHKLQHILHPCSFCAA